MMPGHEDREDAGVQVGVDRLVYAAMMPGHEDREDPLDPVAAVPPVVAAMMPGHEDREDPSPPSPVSSPSACRNDARSRRPGRPPDGQHGPRDTMPPQ